MTEIDKDALEAATQAFIQKYKEKFAPAHWADHEARMLIEPAILAYLAASPVPVVDESEMVFAMHMARNRLEQFADEANAGRAQAGGRELKRTIWGAFQEFDALQPDLPKSAYVAATLDEFGGFRVGNLPTPDEAAAMNDEAFIAAVNRLSLTPAPVEAAPVAWRSQLGDNWNGPHGRWSYSDTRRAGEALYSQASLEALQADMDVLIACVARHTRHLQTAEAEHAKLREKVEFLLDRLDDLERGWDDEEAYREFSGHVAPAAARVRATLKQGG